MKSYNIILVSYFHSFNFQTISKLDSGGDQVVRSPHFVLPLLHPPTNETQPRRHLRARHFGWRHSRRRVRATGSAAARRCNVATAHPGSASPPKGAASSRRHLPASRRCGGEPTNRVAGRADSSRSALRSNNWCWRRLPASRGGRGGMSTCGWGLVWGGRGGR